jgi:hypothetical protein
LQTGSARRTIDSVDPFAHEKLRVDTALLEFERRSVKILISTERAHSLHERSRLTIAHIKDVAAESVTVVEAARCVLLESKR